MTEQHSDSTASYNPSTVTQVAVVQHNAGVDVEANLSKLELLSAQAASEGAQLITWPEAFAYLGRHDGKKAILESLSAGGPILTRCQDLARSLNCHLLLGGFHEAVSDDPERCYNTSVYLDETGSIRASYRKIHLFDVNIPNGPQLMESRQTAPGEKAVCVDTPMGSLGLTICYDVRFPALYQRLATMGAVAMTVPSAFTATTGAAHWHTLLRARAIETQSYIIAPAQHGAHSANRASYGHSLIVDPWGKIIAELPEGDGYVIGAVDSHEVHRIRREVPSLANQRPIN
jgi:predicted amidohydrolase